MTIAILTLAPLLLLATPIFGQPQPLVVDVRPAPYLAAIVYTTNLNHQRFDMRHATLFDMIEFAYDLGEQDDDRENPAIVGGPSWIDLDRLDLTAAIPTSATTPNPYDQVRPVIQRMLSERFHLAFHTEDRPLPGFLVTLAKDGPRLSAAKAPTADGECHGAENKANDQYTVTCTSETIPHFLATLDQDFPHTILDRTGLTKPYDFTLKLKIGPDIHTRDDRARVYTEALNKQLGLAVIHGDIPQPAIVVDHVDRTPAPTPPEIVRQIPPLPDLEFEVASIRPSADDEPHSQTRSTGSQITFSGMQLSELIVRAWQLRTNQLGAALPLLPATRFTILVKLPPGIDGRAITRDRDQIAAMLQKLLIDRFQLRYHWGEWTQPDAYVLLDGSAKMKRSDPASHTFCKFGPPEGEKPARYKGSPFNAEFHCRNVTMPQFAEFLQAMAGSEIKNRVPDKTNLAGAYDLSVAYTTSRALDAQVAAAAKEASGAVAVPVATPVAGLSLEDAFRKQLGLRLERQHLTAPTLILDHFLQTPTEN